MSPDTETIPPALLALILPQPIFYLEEDGFGTVGQVREGLARIAASAAAGQALAPPTVDLPPPAVTGPGGQMSLATAPAAAPRQLAQLQEAPAPGALLAFPDVAGGLLYLIEGRRTPLTPAAIKMLTDLATTALGLPADLMRIVPVEAASVAPPPPGGLEAKLVLLMGWPEEALAQVAAAGGLAMPLPSHQPITVGAARVVATLHPNALAQDKDAKRALWTAIRP